MNAKEVENLFKEADELTPEFIEVYINDQLKNFDPFYQDSIILKILVNLQRRVISLERQTRTENYEDRELLVAVKTIIKHIKQSE